MLKKCVERCSELAKQENGATFTVVLHPCLDDRQFTQEELQSVGELTEVCSQFVFKKTLYLACRRTKKI